MGFVQVESKCVGMHGYGSCCVARALLLLGGASFFWGGGFIFLDFLQGL